jgi:hypothetical protein
MSSNSRRACVSYPTLPRRAIPLAASGVQRVIPLAASGVQRAVLFVCLYQNPFCFRASSPAFAAKDCCSVTNAPLLSESS